MPIAGHAEVKGGPGLAARPRRQPRRHPHHPRRALRPGGRGRPASARALAEELLGKGADEILSRHREGPRAHGAPQVTAIPPRLDGRRVAVTRGRGGEDGLTTRLKALGAEVMDVAGHRRGRRPSPGTTLDARARRAGAASPGSPSPARRRWTRTVSRIVALGHAAGRRWARGSPAVGKATAQRLQELVRAPDLVPGATPPAPPSPRPGSAHAGRAVLVPRAAEGRTELLDGLAAAGADVAAAAAYRTVPAPASIVAPLGDALVDGRMDAVAFASPSAVKSIVAALGRAAALLDRVRARRHRPHHRRGARRGGAAGGGGPRDLDGDRPGRRARRPPRAEAVGVLGRPAPGRRGAPPAGGRSPSSSGPRGGPAWRPGSRCGGAPATRSAAVGTGRTARAAASPPSSRPPAASVHQKSRFTTSVA